jgi:hypothetical protein
MKNVSRHYQMFPGDEDNIVLAWEPVLRETNELFISLAYIHLVGVDQIESLGVVGNLKGKVTGEEKVEVM